MAQTSEPSADQKQSIRLSYSNAGTKPPVYVAASFTSPPWDPQEMQSQRDEEDEGELEFYKDFDDVPAGQHQYKFRLGPGDWWVCDESTDIVTDESGNQNNMFTITPSAKPPTSSSDSAPVKEHNAATQETAPPPDKEPEPAGEPDTEPASDTNNHDIPIPYTVVEEVPDQDRPEDYGDIEGQSLHEDVEKRRADAEPDAVYVAPEATEDAESARRESTSSEVPLVVVEKTDDTPRHGDDMGPDATAGQKLAHEQRAADAAPDEVVISPEEKPMDFAAAVGHDQTTDSPRVEHAPLFRHESGLDVGENTRPELEVEDDDVVGEESVPLFRHETASEEEESKESELPATPRRSSALPESDPKGETPLFAHEAGREEDDAESSPTPSSRPSSRGRQAANDEEDFSDPSLEKFPTDSKGIYEQIKRTGTRLQADKTVSEGTPPSPVRKPAQSLERSVSSQGSSNLGAIEEDRVAEESMDDLPGPSLPPPGDSAPTTSTAGPTQDASSGPREPLTPPLTPKDERQDSLTQSPSASKQSAASSDTAAKRVSPVDGNQSEDASLISQPDATETPQKKPATLWARLSACCGGRKQATGLISAFAIALAAAAVYQYQDPLWNQFQQLIGSQNT